MSTKLQIARFIGGPLDGCVILMEQLSRTVGILPRGEVIHFYDIDAKKKKYQYVAAAPIERVYIKGAPAEGVD
jgi:hypothetical protein